MSRRRAFQIGEQAILQIHAPASGHLVVLNDQMPVGETTCLVPSVFLETTIVPEGAVEVPSRGSAHRAIDVQGPSGWYRVYAIWTASRIDAARLAEAVPENALRIVAGRELAHLDEALLSRRRNDEHYAIMAADYQVVD